MYKIVVNENVKIYTEFFGNPEDIPILLIAGAMAPSVFWNDEFCLTLSTKGYYVIRFDNRDIGKSTHFQQSDPAVGIKLPYSIEDMVKDAKVVLESHTNKSAHVIGHSLGGSITQLFAISYPEKTRSLTAISSPILAKGGLPYKETDPVLTEKLWEVLISNPMHQNFKMGAPEFLRIWSCLNGDWEIDETMANAYTKALYDTEVIGPAWNHTNVQIGIKDIMTELENLDKPILFIHGEKDFLPSNPHNTKLLANKLPNADIFILKNGGHMFFNKKIWEILINRIIEHIEES